MFPAEIEKHDKRQSAVHEIGHAVVAFTKGIVVRSWLEPSGTKDARFDKTWIGHIQNVHGGYDPTGEPAIGIAGIVAECLFNEPEIVAEEIVEQWKNGSVTPSESDLELIHTTNWQMRLEGVEEAMEILAKQKAFFEAATEMLVDLGEVSAHRLMVLASQHLVNSDIHQN